MYIQFQVFYLYPPEAYNNSFVYSVPSLFGCQNKPFPSCLHNEIIEKYKNKSLVGNWSNFGHMSPAIIPLITNYEEVLNAVCMIISFEKKFDIVNFTYNPLVCVDVNLSHVFSYDYFQVIYHMYFLMIISKKKMLLVSFFFLLDKILKGNGLLYPYLLISKELMRKLKRFLMIQNLENIQ